MTKINRVLLRNRTSVPLHGIPAGGEQNVRALDDGQPEQLEHRKRLRDGAFEIVRPDKGSKKKGD